MLCQEYKVQLKDIENQIAAKDPMGYIDQLEEEEEELNKMMSHRSGGGSGYNKGTSHMDTSVINDNNECLKQAVLLANEDYIKTIDGKKIKLKAESICIHGDKKNSYMQAKKIFNSLNKKFNLCPLTEM